MTRSASNQDLDSQNSNGSLIPESAPTIPNNGFFNKIHRDFSVGATSFSIVVLQPIENAKTTLLGQKDLHKSFHYASTFDFFKSTMKRNPLLLWTGTLPNLTVKMPNCFSLYCTNHLLHGVWGDHNISIAMKFSQEALIGVISGACSSFFTHHLEYILAMSKEEGDVKMLIDIPSLYSKVYHEYGWRGLFKFNTLSTCQCSIFGGVYFGLHRTFPKESLIGMIAKYPSLSVLGNFCIEHDMILDFSSAYISCLVGTLVSYPMDVIKTRLFISLKRDTHTPTYSGAFDVIKRVYGNEGVGGFVSQWKLGGLYAFAAASLMVLFEKYFP